MFMSEELTARHAGRRRALIAAAREVVSNDGFAGLQMLSVAAAAGTAVGTIYRYFPSKAELCAALVAEVSARELQVLSEVSESGAPPAEALAAAVAVFARRAMADRRLAYAMIAEPVEPAVDAQRLIWRARIGEALAAVVARGQRAGVFRRCAPRLAAACITGAFMEALVGPLSPTADAGDPAALADEIAALCQAMMTNNETPGATP